MFKKPFHVKKNVNLRNSDAKKIISKIPSCPDVFDRKTIFAHVKAVSATDVVFNIYTSEKIPFLFDFDDQRVFPTVYFLWKCPSAFPMLIVHAPVFQYLENGADLMLQGVAKAFPVRPFNKGDPIGIALDFDGKVQPVASGCALMSYEEMVNCDFKGKGVQTLHVFRDYLWEFGQRTQPVTFDFSAVLPTENADEIETDEEINEQVALATEQLSNANLGESEDSPAISYSHENPDQLLERCFIAALKYRVTKKGTLPLDVGQFYSQFLLKCIPTGQRLDIKKTKNKKFGAFLTEINKRDPGPVIKITSKAKGVDLISEIFWDHPLIRGFTLTDEIVEDEISSATGSANKGTTLKPQINEYFAITEKVVPLFIGFVSSNKPKGLLLSSSDVRNFITEYVKRENLQSGSRVKLDPLLANLMNSNAVESDWNTIMQKIQNHMTKTFLIRLPDGREFVRKISMPKIVFKIEKRSGNKKVTLINNLSVFGIDVKNLAHDVQVGASTSATINPEAVLCEGPQLAVQGNQVAFIADVLINTLGIDKKFIDGLDLAPKKKK